MASSLNDATGLVEIGTSHQRGEASQIPASQLCDGKGRPGNCTQRRRKEMEHKIFVSVQRGVAEVCEETVPAGIVVEILDFDNFNANPERELSLWSPELREYWAKNHAQWGRCGDDCPCRVEGMTS